MLVKRYCSNPQNIVRVPGGRVFLLGWCSQADQPDHSGKFDSSLRWRYIPKLVFSALTSFGFSECSGSRLLRKTTFMIRYVWVYFDVNY